MWMMRFARAGNGGGLAASGFADAACAPGTSKPASFSNAAKPNMPSPVPICRSIRRRVSRRGGRCSRGFMVVSVEEHGFVGNQQHLGELFPSGQVFLRSRDGHRCFDETQRRRSLMFRRLASKHAVKQNL